MLKVVKEMNKPQKVSISVFGILIMVKNRSANPNGGVTEWCAKWVRISKFMSLYCTGIFDFFWLLHWRRNSDKNEIRLTYLHRLLFCFACWRAAYLVSLYSNNLVYSEYLPQYLPGIESLRVSRWVAQRISCAYQQLYSTNQTLIKKVCKRHCIRNLSLLLYWELLTSVDLLLVGCVH